MESIEKTAETIEAAIDAGLRALNCTADDVMVEVLDEPSRGIFGIGARPARVKLIFIGRRPEPPPPPAPVRSEPAPEERREPREPREPRPAKANNTKKRKDGRNKPPREASATTTSLPVEAAAGEAAESAPTPANRAPRNNRNEGRSDGRNRGRNRGGDKRRNNQRSAQASPSFEMDFDEEEDFSVFPTAAIVPDEQADEDARVGKEMLVELLVKMGFEAEVTIHRADATRSSEEMHWILNIAVQGDDVQRLVGRRGDTLSSLQYLLRLMLSRRVQHRANIIVDAGEYKRRRSERLQQLAIRMADQAVSQARTVTLEPMPPNERRIIHLTLRERDDVETKSIGEGNARKVTISPARR